MTEVRTGANESGVAAARRWRTRLSTTSPTPDPVLDVVFICTGNRFRSALAEALLREGTGNAGVLVSSAGTLDLGSAPALPEAIEHGRRLGVDLEGHRARYIGTMDLRQADLVIGFEQIHIATAVVEAGARRDRCFTLPELADLLGAPGETPRDTIAMAHAVRIGDRERHQPVEIADPLGQSGAVFLATANEIADLVTTLVQELFRLGSRQA